jgi:hypothetical protein
VTTVPDTPSAAPAGRGPTRWQDPGLYDKLRTADRRAFAWEWLRRTRPYCEAWSRHARGRGASPPDARQFGLERLEDPALPVPVARPVWSSRIDPGVLQAAILDPFASVGEQIDLRQLLPFVSIAIGSEQVEHLLLSDGLRSLRIDLNCGTLIGCPAALHFRLHGISALQAPIAALRRLTVIVDDGGFERLPAVQTRRRDRWILELRVADALRSGARQQDIARTLFGDRIADARWRTCNPSHRLQVQRLVKAARANLAAPLSHRWFA